MPILASAGSSAMHGAVVPIAYATGNGTSTNAFSFSNIPQKYQDLFVVISAKVVGSGANYYGFSVSDRTNYSITNLAGNGSSATSARGTSNQFFIQSLNNGLPIGSSYPCVTELHILNYANTTTYKTFLWRTSFDQNGSGETSIKVGLHTTDTTAVTNFSVELDTGSVYFTSDTTVALYGVRSVGQ
jgi:hypothetical protein